MTYIHTLIFGLLPVLALASTASAQMRVDARIQMSAGSCSGCDLSNKALNGVRLNNANLTNSLFKNSNLSGGTLDGSDLSGANFKSALMYRVRGNGVTMLRAEFEDATLTEANLPNSKLVDANLSRADLSRSIFTNSDFTNARLNETNFSGSQLQGVNFSGADLSTSQGLQQAQLDEACGDENTRLPVGLFLSNCEGETSEDTRTTPERLDHAISDIENLLAASSTDDQGLHTRLQRIHNDLVQAKSALMH